VYVGRPSKWGNPFVIGKHGDRAQCIELYRRWIRTQPDLLAALPSLHGKILGCWCAPLPCHADVLAALAAEIPPDPAARACAEGLEQFLEAHPALKPSTIRLIQDAARILRRL
jgi:hypothetical protein